MTDRYILALDQGTTTSRALVIDEQGAIRAVAHQPLEQIYLQPGWVEHRPDDIWHTTIESARRAIAEAGIEPGQIAGIGIANQRETIIAWDRTTGRPVWNAIVWQDRRTVEHCDRLRAEGHEQAIAHSTGLRLDPYFSATKLAWILEQQDLRQRAEAGEILAGTVDSWLLWRLTGGAVHATDFTNASRTLLFDVRRGRWDDDLLRLFNVPASMLPRIYPSRAMFGTTDPELLGAAVPVLGMAGDQQAALFGQGCTHEGMLKCTYGTGCFMLVNRGRRNTPSENGLLVSLGAGTGAAGPEYVAEGSVFIAGAAVQWLREGLGMLGAPSDIEQLAASVPDTGGVEFVPAFTGLGAPYWDPSARGTILGLTRGTGRAHMARAALEAIALSCTDVIAAMEADLGGPVRELRVDGGASGNDLLMQMQADYAGVPVVRARQREATAVGVAHLAGLQAGIWSSPEELAARWESERTFEPRIGDDERLRRLDRWRRAVDRARHWATEE